MNDEYTRERKEAVQVKNSQIYSKTTNQIHRYFYIASSKAMKENATLRFRPFDGTGYFQFRCGRRDSNTDGITVEELLSADFDGYMRFAVQRIATSKRKPRIRVSAVLTGGAKKANKVFHDFDWIYHLPLPPDCQIQNGKILRTRVGDKFKYDLVLTIRVPVSEVVSPSKLNGTIGIDIGFRPSGDTVLVATVMTDDAAQPPLEVKAPLKMVSALEHVIVLQSELDDAATDLGKAITPLLLANPLPDDYPKFKLWQSVAKRPAFVTLSYEKAYKFALWLNHEPDTFPKEITGKVFTWWRSYSRKYRGIHNRRKKQLTHRKHFYRQVAYDLVAQRKLIVLEKIDLSRFAET